MNVSAVRSSPWLWEELAPSMSFAEQRAEITRRDLDLWRLVSTRESAVSRALLVPLMMRAFIAASAPRLPGNIHVSQELVFPGRVPVEGEQLAFTFTVGGRSERKGRGWVDILVECRAVPRAEILMTGKMVLIWAGRQAALEMHDD